jgi:hypothetical protein
VLPRWQHRVIWDFAATRAGRTYCSHGTNHDRQVTANSGRGDSGFPKLGLGSSVSARALAAKLQPGSTVRWDRLERAGFAAHPSVLEDGGAKPKVRKSKWNLIWGIPLVILYFFCYLAPIWGTAAISVSRFQTYRQDPEETIPLSGTLFLFALLLLVVSFGHWIITGRRRNGFYEVQAALALTLGGLSAAAVRMNGLDKEIDSWQTWIIPIIVTVVLATVFLVLLVIARVSQGARAKSKPRDEGDDVPSNKIELLKRRRERVAALSDAERASIARDIVSSIIDLEQRGLISAHEAERARGAELGALALRMPRGAKRK